MKSELHHVKHPHNMVLFWVGVYLLLTLITIFVVHEITERIRLHSLPSGSVGLQVPYSKYLTGEVVSFTVKNNFNSPIYISNNCPEEPLTVYRKTGTTWVRVHDKTTVDKCPNQDRQIEVPANGEISGSFEAWKNLINEPGLYRVVVYVEYYNALPYQEFEIIERPPDAIAASGTQTTPTNSSQQPQTTTTPSQQAPTPAPDEGTVKKSQTFSSAGGSIQVQYDQTAIYVTSIAPAPGCTYEGGRSGPQVQIEFKCGGTETQVTLRLVDGNIVQQTKTEND